MEMGNLRCEPESNVINDKRFNCQFCTDCFPDTRTMLDHIRSHNSDNPWNCNCSTSRRSSSSCGLEATSHSPTCLLNVEEKSDLVDEVESNDEGIDSTSIAGATHKCTLCSFSSPYLLTVVQHIKTHLRKKENNESEIDYLKINSHKRNKREPAENVYNCTECHFSCLYLDKLEKHISTHNPNALFNCRFCPFVANCKKSWLSHHKLHGSEKPHQCPTCNKRFSRLDNMKTHQELHTPERPYACHLCNYTARNKGRLLKHTNLHKKENGFIYRSKEDRTGALCPICNGLFYNYAYLKVHVKSHLREPFPFECTQCQTTLTTLDEFHSHFIHHIEEIALSCSSCSFKCFDTQQLSQHASSAHSEMKPYLCELCGYRFRKAVHWRRHRLVHTGEKPYQCDVCGAKFSQSNNRKAHMIKIHSLYLPLKRRLKAAPSQ